MKAFYCVCEAHKPEKRQFQKWIQVVHEPKPVPAVCDSCDNRAEWMVIEYEKSELTAG